MTLLPNQALEHDADSRRGTPLTFGMIRIFLMALLVAPILGGCFSINENKEEAAMVASFSGNPHIDGRYKEKGLTLTFDGRWVTGWLSYVMRDPEQAQLKHRDIDTIVISHQSDILIFDFASDGVTQYSIRLLPKKDYSATDREVVIKRRVDDPGGDEGFAEIHMALDSKGKLKMVVHQRLLSYTGVAIPIVPYHHTDDFQYVFDPVVATSL
jgi:hypothetical protein